MLQYHMKERLRNFVKKPDSRNVTINTLGNYLNVAFTALFALVLVRIMSPAEYGVLSVLLGIAYVLANVLDFGTTATIYSNIPILLENKSQRLYTFLKTTFTFQFIFSGTVIIILLFTFPYLDRVFFKTNAPSWELYITSFSILFLIWQNFALNVLFAANKFLSANIYNNLQNVIKMIVLFALIATKTITVGAVLFIYGILGPIVFFVLIFFEKKAFILILSKAAIKKEEFKFGYTATFFFGNQLFNLGGRMDLFLLSFFSLRNDVGYYGLSQKIILSIVTTVVSITQVLSPKFAKVHTKKETLKELRYGFFYLLIPAALFLLLFLTPNGLFYLFFTEKFAKTAYITKLLVPSYIIFTLGALPLQFVLYTIKKPGYVLYGNILYFLIMTLGCYFLIPKLHVEAPLYVNFVAMLAPVSLISLATLYEYRKLPQQ